MIRSPLQRQCFLYVTKIISGQMCSLAARLRHKQLAGFTADKPYTETSCKSDVPLICFLSLAFWIVQCHRWMTSVYIVMFLLVHLPGLVIWRMSTGIWKKLKINGACDRETSYDPGATVSYECIVWTLHKTFSSKLSSISHDPYTTLNSACILTYNSDALWMHR